MTDRRIATTMRPDQIVTVNDQEFVDLTRMGLIDREVPYSLDDVPAPIQIAKEADADGGEEDHGK